MAVVARVKKSAGDSGMFPEGFHRAILASVDEHSTKTNSSVRLTLENGKYQHVEDLWLSEGAQARLTIMARRLGVFDDEGDDEQEIDFEEAQGQEFVICIKHEKNQSDRTVSKLEYAGLWPLDHEDKKVVAFLESEAGKKPAVIGDEGEKPSGKKAADDLGDI